MTATTPRRWPRWSWRGWLRCTPKPRGGGPKRHAGARRDLGGRVPPEAVAPTLVALSKEGSRLAAQVREVSLVEEALDAVAPEL